MGLSILELPHINGRFPLASGLVLLALQCSANELITLVRYILDSVVTPHHFFGVILFFASWAWWVACIMAALFSLLTHNFVVKLKSFARFLFYGSPALLCLGGLVAGPGFFPVHPLSYYHRQHPISYSHYVFLMGISVVVIVLSSASAMLCATSLLLGHRYVSSKALGGTGVEIMNIWLRGRGIALESIPPDQADEAGQGWIRL